MKTTRPPSRRSNPALSLYRCHRTLARYRRAALVGASIDLERVRLLAAVCGRRFVRPAAVGSRAPSIKVAA